MAASSDVALTVFAWGNQSRGDDAIGTILASRIVDLDNAAINLVEDHQLNIEHVMDIVENVTVLFIDASMAIKTGYKLEKLTPFRDASISTHSISPVALLDLYERTVGKSAPEAYMLHVRGSKFELGEDICTLTGTFVNEAWEFLDSLFARPCDSWDSTLRSTSIEKG